MRQLNLGSKILSELTFVRSYPKIKSDGRKETEYETIERVCQSHIKRYPKFQKKIEKYFEKVHQKMVVPSMRSMQFAGDAIERSNSRMYNCCFLGIDSFKAIADVFFLSMNGCGCGYSIEKHHIQQLPVISEGFDETYIIEDDKESWCDSMLKLMMNPRVQFDYSKIRPVGSKLSTGGIASGPEPLAKAHENVRSILKWARGKKLRSIDVHDIICHIADAVVVGGVRRSALISLFDANDDDMLFSKSGNNWFFENPQRQRANNSAVLYRNDPGIEFKIRRIMEILFKNNTGEPGIFFSNNRNFGTNPCGEIGLYNRQKCNLTEINAAACRNEQDFLDAAEAATGIGTFQATYTDFKYIDKRFKENCEKDALLGVSITGQAENWDLLSSELLKNAAFHARHTNKEVSSILGINESARIGCTKPSGTTSLWLATASGIHAIHDQFYLRRVRLDLMDPLVSYLAEVFGGIGSPESGNVLERDKMNKSNVVFTAPVKKEKGIFRNKESAIQLLERSKFIFQNWILPTHRYGENSHNVSITINYKKNEYEDIINWVIQNRDCFASASFFPYDDTVYPQMPFESIDEHQYNLWNEKFEGVEVDLNTVNFTNTVDDRVNEQACMGGVCEIK